MAAVCAKRRSRRRAAGIALAVALLCLGAAAFSWLAASTPARDTPEEYARFWRLYEDEALLGKGKDEVRDLVGYPNGWAMDSTGVSFPKGYDPWDDEIHMFMYSTGTNERGLTVHVYFSVEQKAEYVLYMDGELDSSSLEFFEQGTESKYY